jgi:hypothetical protein
MFGRRRVLAGFGVAAALGLNGFALTQQKEYKPPFRWAEPPVVAPGEKPGDPPADAIVLFDGKSLDAWENGNRWEVKDGYAVVKGSDIRTKQKFGDVQLHVEFATPEKVDPKQKGQARGNSGVFLMDRFEVQVLDNYDNGTYFDGQCGALYKQSPPMVNVCRKPGEWQTYDITFTTPKLGDDGTVVKPAAVTVFHNGVCVQNHYELTGKTDFWSAPSYDKPFPAAAPIRLQNHGNPVRYRNIWVRELRPIVGVPVEKKA